MRVLVYGDLGEVDAEALRVAQLVADYLVAQEEVVSVSMRSGAGDEEVLGG